MVALAGNPRHEVSVSLERDGRQLEEGDPDYVKPLPIRRVMTAEDEPIVWRFELSEKAASTLWCVIAWGEPFGQGIRTQAFKVPLNDGDQFWEWKWFRFYRRRRAVESWLGSHGPRWFRRIAGRPRRLGKWRRFYLRPLQPGQSPIDSGVVPK